jgi:hypothetical protein
MNLFMEGGGPSSPTGCSRDHYRKNLKNFQSMGIQVMKNHFKSGSRLRLWTGPN